MSQTIAYLTQIWSVSRISSNWDSRYAKSPPSLGIRTISRSTPTSPNANSANKAHKWLSGKNSGERVPGKVLAGKMARKNVITPNRP